MATSFGRRWDSVRLPLLHGFLVAAAELHLVVSNRFDRLGAGTRCPWRGIALR